MVDAVDSKSASPKLSPKGFYRVSNPINALTVFSGAIGPSADSVNVARNFNDQKVCPERMARRIDSVQCPIVWHQRPIQLELEQ